MTLVNATINQFDENQFRKRHLQNAFCSYWSSNVILTVLYSEHTCRLLFAIIFQVLILKEKGQLLGIRTKLAHIIKHQKTTLESKHSLLVNSLQIPFHLCCLFFLNGQVKYIKRQSNLIRRADKTFLSNVLIMSFSNNNICLLSFIIQFFLP